MNICLKVVERTVFFQNRLTKIKQTLLVYLTAVNMYVQIMIVLVGLMKSFFFVFGRI